MKYILLTLFLISLKIGDCQSTSYYEREYLSYSHSYHFLTDELFRVEGTNFFLEYISHAESYNNGNFKIIYSMPYSYYYHNFPTHKGDSLSPHDTMRICLQFSKGLCVSRETTYSIPYEPEGIVKITEKFFNNNFKEYYNLVDSIFIEKTISISKFKTLESIRFNYDDTEEDRNEEHNLKIFDLLSARLQTHPYNPKYSNPYQTERILENRKINYFLSENFQYFKKGFIFYFDPFHAWPSEVLTCSMGTPYVSHSVFSESPSFLMATVDSLSNDDKYIITIWSPANCTDNIVSCHSKLKYDSKRRLLSVHNDFKSEVYASIKSKTVSEFEYLDDKTIIETLKIYDAITERSFKIKYELIY